MGRPQADPVAAAAQNAAQDGVGQVIEEQRRHALDAAGSQRQIGCLQRRGADQQVAERGEDLKVFGGHRVLQPQQRHRGDRSAWLVKQRRVQLALGTAGLIDRRQLGAQQIGTQEIIAGTWWPSSRRSSRCQPELDRYPPRAIIRIAFLENG